MLLHFKREDGRYVLRNDAGDALWMNGEEAAQLADIGRQIRDLLALSSQQRYEPLPAKRAHTPTLTVDAHHTTVVFQMTDEHGVQFGYLLSLDDCFFIRDRLTTLIEVLRTAAKGRSHQ